MEAKPIITCHGNQSLFSTLHSIVVSGLPKDVCEWRRSYGRAPRSVQLEGSFVPYDPDILPEEDTKTLVSRPYFHIYWTDCDLDSYKQTVRDDLNEWQSALKAKNIPDWLIVVVIPDESKVKAKLLPRSSVIDKVRNDFCGKQPERSVVLMEPLKNEAKSVESWHQLFQKLRVLLLSAYNRHLNKYEENMRALRERRNEPGWNYFEYFAVQEELGFMLEVLGLKEDALIQYDELDAMFDQFVENHASGESVKWLFALLKPCNNWTGLSLAKPIDLELRDRVKRSLTSLLEFRNYLFCRQAALLFAMGRPFEVAERSFDFLQNTVGEMKALEVELPEGALQCWVVLSGLEVLAACQKHDTGQVDKCAIFTAHLWDHVRNKLKELGHLCSLMPGMIPTSEQLNRVLDLKSGMVLSPDQTSASDVNPVDKLQEALSSPGAFKKHYLEMCELAMGTYKHISRFRSSRMIGRELAAFYMSIGEAQKAEVFLLDAIKMYRQEGWVSLAHATMRELAACQQQMGHTHRFVKTACEVACSPYLPDPQRSLHFDQVMTALRETEGSITVDGSGLIKPHQVTLRQCTVKVDEEVTMMMRVHSGFPQPVTCDCVQVALSPCPAAQLLQSSEADDTRPPPSPIHPSPVTVDIQPPSAATTPAHRKAFPCQINPRAMYERRQGKVIVAGITCENAHELLQRTDSTSYVEAMTTPVKGDYSMSLSVTNVVLKPGVNDVELTMKASEEGVFAASQACVQVKGLQVLIPLNLPHLHLCVACHRPRLTLTPKHAGDFIAGIEQAVTLTLNLGSQTVERDTPAALRSPIPIKFSTQDGQEGEGSFTLPPQGPHSNVDVDIRVCLPLEQEKTQPLTALVECVVDGWPEPVSEEIKFVLPLRAAHHIYTAREAKYVQIMLNGDSDASLVVTSPELSASNAKFTFLNPGQDWSVCGQQGVSLVWQLETDAGSDDVGLTAAFTCHFTCAADLSKQLQAFSYTCHLQHFQTWYIVDYWLSGEKTPKIADISGHKTNDGNKAKVPGYEAGVTYVLNVSVTPVASHCSSVMPHQLAYTVSSDSTAWAFSGKTTGVFSVSEKAYRTQLKVVPLAAGFRHLPKVTLHRYLGDNAQQSEGVWVKREDVTKEKSEDKEDSSAPLPQQAEETSDVTCLCMEELSEGRVYNASLAKQVHVYPTPATSDMEVTMAT